MREFPVRIKTDYLETQKQKDENKKLMRLAGVAAIVGLSAPKWLPVIAKWGAELEKILSTGNLIH